LEYIQCQHCEKKYAVSERLRTAVGKQIRCKHCWQLFEIEIRHDTAQANAQQHDPRSTDRQRPDVTAPAHAAAPDERPDERKSDRQSADRQRPEEQLFDKGADLQAGGDAAHNAAFLNAAEETLVSASDDGDVAMPAAVSDEGDRAGRDESEEHSDQTGVDKSSGDKEGAETAEKKRFNLHALISSLLGFILIGLSAAGYLYLYQPQLLQLQEQAERQAIIPQQLVNPMQLQGPQPAGAQQPRQLEPEAPRDAASAPKSLLDGPDNPSQVCRDVAADYWLRTRMLVTTKLATDAYMQLLNMNLEQADEIRKLCRDRLQLGRLTSAAKAGQMPPWISREIRSRQSSVLPQPADHR